MQLKHYIAIWLLLLTGDGAIAQRMTFQSLAISVYDWRAAGDTFQITLTLTNISDASSLPHEIGVASVPDSPVAQDFTNQTWYFQGGGAVLPTGRNADEWVVLRPGGSIPVTYRFRSYGSRHEPPFTFSHRLKLYNMDQRPPQVLPVFFGPLGQQRPQTPLYPSPRGGLDSSGQSMTLGGNVPRGGDPSSEGLGILLQTLQGVRQNNQGGNNGSLSADDCPKGYKMINGRWT